MQLTLYFSSSDHVSSRNTGHVNQVDWAAGLHALYIIIISNIQISANRILEEVFFCTLFAMVTAR